MKNIFVLIVMILLGIALYSVFTTGGGVSFKKFFVVPGIGSSTVSNVQMPPAPAVKSQTVPYTTQTITPPEGFTANQLSPIYQQVRITKGWLSNGFEIDLSAFYSSSNQKIDITGWRVQGNRDSFTIPQAIANYVPYGFEEIQDITLTSGSYVKIYNAISPIGQNLRLNKCIGYLDSQNTKSDVGYNFIPSLPNTCPSLDRGEIVLFSSRCQTLIRGLYGCAHRRRTISILSAVMVRNNVRHI